MSRGGQMKTDKSAGVGKRGDIGGRGGRGNPFHLAPLWLWYLSWAAIDCGTLLCAILVPFRQPRSDQMGTQADGTLRRWGYHFTENNGYNQSYAPWSPYHQQVD